MDILVNNTKTYELILPSHAKINLGLYILGKRQDGYHDICTIFQELEFHDTLYFRRQSGDLAITTDHPSLPVGEENLVYRAVKLLKGSTGCSDQVTIHIKKNIPLGSGLGGGSSNAAMTLVGLNRLFQLGLSVDTLASLGSELGSDVPFFLYGGIALATGRGENIQPLPDSLKGGILLINPGIQISSGWAYKNVNLKLTNSEDLNNVLPRLRNGVITGAYRFSLKNMLEEPVIKKYPIMRSIKSQLLKYGAEWAMMSGSGSTVFGIFRNKELAEKTLRQMERPDWLMVVTGTKQRKSLC